MSRLRIPSLPVTRRRGYGGSAARPGPAVAGSSDWPHGPVWFGPRSAAVSPQVVHDRQAVAYTLVPRKEPQETGR